MIMILIIITCTVIGILAAMFMPYTIPTALSPYFAIGILAGLDSIFGGIASNINNNFRMKIFLTGFFGNALLAAALTHIGKILNVDIYFAAVLVFGTRLFQNFAVVRRFALNKYTNKN